MVRTAHLHQPAPLHRWFVTRLLCGPLGPTTRVSYKASRHLPRQDFHLLVQRSFSGRAIDKLYHHFAELLCIFI